MPGLAVCPCAPPRASAHEGRRLSCSRLSRTRVHRPLKQESDPRWRRESAACFTSKPRYFLSTTGSEGTAARFCPVSGTLHSHTCSNLATGQSLLVTRPLWRKGRGERERGPGRAAFLSSPPGMPSGAGHTAGRGLPSGRPVWLSGEHRPVNQEVRRAHRHVSGSVPWRWGHERAAGPRPSLTDVPLSLALSLPLPVKSIKNKNDLQFQVRGRGDGTLPPELPWGYPMHLPRGKYCGETLACSPPFPCEQNAHQVSSVPPALCRREDSQPAMAAMLAAGLARRLRPPS